jgi:hypothetical protein
MLKIQEHLKKEGLKKTLQKFRLEEKDLGHKVMLKYDQLRSPKQYTEVHEARGIVFEKDTWAIMSLPFKRFFSQDDFYSPKLNWKQTVVMEKRDGSLIQVYWDFVTNLWSVNTMFSECEELIYRNGKMTDISLGSLFNDLMKEYGTTFDKFVKGNTYVFELTSPHNKVVVTYDKPELRLIGARNLKTLNEYSFSELQEIAAAISIPIVETYAYGSLQECLDTFKNKSFNFEGYVAWDGYGRIKIKNPGYVAVHLTKTKEESILDLSEPHLLLDVVKQNEIDEFASAFPHASTLVKNLHGKYTKLLNDLNKAGELIKPPKNITPAERKLHATAVFTTLNQFKIDQSLGNVFFLLKDHKVASIEDYIYNYDNKKLYKLLK